MCFAPVSASRLCIEIQRMTTYFQRAWLRRHLCHLKAISTVPSYAGKTSHATPFSTMTSSENAYVRELCIWHHHQPILCHNKAGSIFGWDQVNQSFHQPRTKWLSDGLTPEWVTGWLTDRLIERINQSSIDVCKASNQWKHSHACSWYLLERRVKGQTPVPNKPYGFCGR